MNDKNIHPIVIALPDRGEYEAFEKSWHEVRLANPLLYAANGSQCLDLLSSHNAAAVVLDPTLGGDPNGITLADGLKQDSRHKNIPLILYTGTPDLSRRALSEKSEPDAVVAKPMVLKVIQVLQDLCELEQKPFHPFSGTTPDRSKGGDDKSAS